MFFECRSLTLLLVVAATTGNAYALGESLEFGSTNDSRVVAPPAEEVTRLRLDPFYRKYVAIEGFPVVSSDQVPDAALLEAVWIVRQMLSTRKDILQALAASKVRLVVMSHDELTTMIPEHSDLRPRDYWDRRARGLGATDRRPAVSCGAENLLGYPGDPYSTENILVHEFGHVIHEIGLKRVDPSFDARLKIVWEQSLAAGLWTGTYAASNRSEFWAEGVQCWFDTNRENDSEHNHVNTRAELKAYDPSFANLLQEVFGDGDWRYTRPESRRMLPHLQDWDPQTNPAFQWPADTVARYRGFQRATSGESLDGLDPAWQELPLHPPEGWNTLRSPATRERTPLLIVNRRKSPVHIDWIDFQGRLKPNGQVQPGRYEQIESFEGHLFLLSTGDDRIGIVAATGERTRLLLAPEETEESRE